MEPSVTRFSRRDAVRAGLALMAVATLGCRAQDSELPYEVRAGVIIPEEHRDLLIPLTQGEALKLKREPGLETELVESFHGTHSAGTHISLKGPGSVVKIKRDGALVFTGRYQHQQFQGGVLVEADRTREFKALRLDYGSDKVLVEMVRIAVGPDGARGEPQTLKVTDQFDPVPLYRHYYPRMGDDETRETLVRSYVKNFAPHLDLAAATELLTRS